MNQVYMKNEVDIRKELLYFEKNYLIPLKFE